MKELTVPTFVVWGRQDVRSDLEEARQYIAALPQGRLLIYENCGHLPYLEYPGRFNSDLKGFLAEVRA
jgi:pimeloyl-ACP methyl ester carboxylesterase